MFTARCNEDLARDEARRGRRWRKARLVNKFGVKLPCCQRNPWIWRQVQLSYAAARFTFDIPLSCHNGLPNGVIDRHTGTGHAYSAESLDRSHLYKKIRYG